MNHMFTKVVNKSYLKRRRGECEWDYAKFGCNCKAAQANFEFCFESEFLMSSTWSNLMVGVTNINNSISLLTLVQKYFTPPRILLYTLQLHRNIMYSSKGVKKKT